MSAASLRRKKEISFFDEDGIHWSVVRVPAGRVLGAGPVALEFTSDGGERRVASAHVLETAVAGRAVDERAWPALLRDAVLLT